MDVIDRNRVCCTTARRLASACWHQLFKPFYVEVSILFRFVVDFSEHDTRLCRANQKEEAGKEVVD